MIDSGIVTLDGEEVGTFHMNYREEITIEMRSGTFLGISEALEFAADNGMVLGLGLKPDYNSEVI